MTTTIEVLRQARSLIDTPGKWCQGSYGEGPDPFDYSQRCAFGAFCDARTELGLDGTARDTALDYSLASKDAWDYRHTGSYVTFNDHPDTTHQDIMDLFDKAIKIAEAS